ncbi:glycosyltransferase family 2 protein [Photobacterium chitinilyticum]|uniref:Capsular biosynthesis protein n=1 Tax=Photobacterium chitinilyticum TaxID=2485123 RepID=A0A3S4TNN7_9GAMM|nr:glycosyltransferase family 2 protein [Photobacterium chitinilyticum]RWX56585.1 capsular biosynthesis protein [Photobacterium chitinilyticum]
MIVIPMAGLSSRFFKAGYKKPKYMLEAHGETLFSHAINSFKQYFKTEKFLFIIRDVYETATFVEQQIKSLGIKDYHISILDSDTRGQAETVALGLNGVDYQGPITIFNIDTFRPNFQFPDLEKMGGGYLEVFQGEGDNWSFAKPIHDGDTRVSLTAEKKPISNLCCTGLYYFSDLKTFVDSYNEYLSMPKEKWEKGELYVAPLYNFLIKKGIDIHYHLIDRDEVVFCGVPDEYTEFKMNKTY